MWTDQNELYVSYQIIINQYFCNFHYFCTISYILFLKLIDFGISKILTKGRIYEQCGTPAFLSPEIILNKGYEGFASDFWSLGIVLYVLLYGKVPFRGSNIQELH